MSISVILTVHNEGEELRRTIRSITSNTKSLREIIIIDDGSTDGCCRDFNDKNIKIIRHEERIGVAWSRNEGAENASGDVLAFFDGHQRVTKQCLDKCARLSLRKNAIVSPTVQGFHQFNKPIYGASFRLCPENGFFSADWVTKFPWKKIRQLTALRGPGYCIPKQLYHELKWIDGMTGWGGSESLITLKAFFTRTPILYVRGPVAYHLFKKQFHYQVDWKSIWLNHALIARVCFSQKTWDNYWMPELFQDNLTFDQVEMLDSESVCEQHDQFQEYKNRNDSEFWRLLLKQEYPETLVNSLS